jgi:hypothetical protein
MPTRNFRTGDAVWIDCEGRRVAGNVLLASGNGKSLMLRFDAVIDGHMCMMPVSRSEDGSYFSIVTGVEVRLSARDS